MVTLPDIRCSRAVKHEEELTTFHITWYMRCEVPCGAGSPGPEQRVAEQIAAGVPHIVSGARGDDPPRCHSAQLVPRQLHLLPRRLPLCHPPAQGYFHSPVFFPLAPGIGRCVDVRSPGLAAADMLPLCTGDVRMTPSKLQDGTVPVKLSFESVTRSLATDDTV